MSTNQLVILVAIGVVIGAALLWPLLRGKGTPAADGSSFAPSPRQALPDVDELAELEMDRAMGRVSESDYERLRSRLESGGGAAAATPAAAVADPVPTPAVEATEARPAAAPGTTNEAEALVRRWRDLPRPACPRCGGRPEAGARFCSKCGTALA
ncbi:hypothetical protein BAC2_00235 [uncultured bacterium]|nr:hypothetical protein BAC2_00235 [uncultured bacterium]